MESAVEESKLGCFAILHLASATSLVRIFIEGKTTRSVTSATLCLLEEILWVPKCRNDHF